jgi:predicted Zn-dependent protease
MNDSSKRADEQKVAIRPTLTILFAALAASVALRASAKTDVLRTRSGSVVHWAASDITIGFDASAPSRTVAPAGASEALQAAVEAWNEVPELPVRLRAVTTPDPTVRIRFCRGRWTGDLDDLGKALFTADIPTGVVTSAAVEINECEHSFLAPDEVQDGHFDLQAVITHELGHVLGLAHSDDPNALMFPRGGTGGIRIPKTDDRAKLALIYGGSATTGRSHEPPPTERVPAMSGEPAPSEQVTRALERMPPPEVVTAMRVAASDGRAIVVYTCEPTLLPPVSPVESGPDQKQASRRMRGRHAHREP